MSEAGDKFHMVLPLDHPELPWFAVFFGGLWISNLFYWGCNQFITQRALGAKNIVQARYGVVFAAYIKLLIPFIVVIPGIVAGVLYADDLSRSDMAYPLLLQRLLPSGLTGLMFAALLAAIMSSLDSMLNSAATIFTIDIYQRRLRPDSSQRHLIAVGRTSTVAFLLIAAAWSPVLLRFERVFSYIQEFWGLITPGVAIVFLGSLFWRRTTSSAATWVMAATLPATIGVKLLIPEAAFLDQMWVAGLVLGALLVGRSLATPGSATALATASQNTDSSALPRQDRLFDLLCAVLVALTLALYWIFF
ncbi:MAG: hypothetical protein IID06_01745 [Gemmatimonadetes bacterium]|nr:hypothetical protein [Gemmatimonadota bacterium]